MKVDRLNQIQETTGRRAVRWGADWTVLEAAGEMCGEAGELANVCKKIRRLEKGVIGNGDAGLREKAKGEIGDVLITLCNLANILGINVDEAVTESFNLKSEQLGFPERI